MSVGAISSSFRAAFHCALSGWGVQTGIDQRPALLAAQKIAVDNVERVGKGYLHLYDVFGDVADGWNGSCSTSGLEQGCSIHGFAIGAQVAAVTG